MTSQPGNTTKRSLQRFVIFKITWKIKTPTARTDITVLREGRKIFIGIYNIRISLYWIVGSTERTASSVSSFIPWQGSFHVSLNVEESTVLLFRPVFEKLYKKLFRQNKVRYCEPLSTLTSDIKFPPPYPREALLYLGKVNYMYIKFIAHNFTTTISQ